MDPERPTKPPSLVLNPAGDEEFGSLARRLAADNPSAQALESHLRSSYPGAVVHERVLSGERPVLLYVYRDGRWVG